MSAFHQCCSENNTSWGLDTDVSTCVVDFVNILRNKAKWVLLPFLLQIRRRGRGCGSEQISVEAVFLSPTSQGRWSQDSSLILPVSTWGLGVVVVVSSCRKNLWEGIKFLNSGLLVFSALMLVPRPKRQVLESYLSPQVSVLSPAVWLVFALALQH